MNRSEHSRRSVSRHERERAKDDEYYPTSRSQSHRARSHSRQRSLHSSHHSHHGSYRDSYRARARDRGRDRDRRSHRRRHSDSYSCSPSYSYSASDSLSCSYSSTPRSPPSPVQLRPVSSDSASPPASPGSTHAMGKGQAQAQSQAQRQVSFAAQSTQPNTLGLNTPGASTLGPTIRLGATTRTSLYRQHVSYAGSFFGYVNSLITAANQQAVANDSDRKSMIQHVLWVSFWIALIAAGLIVAVETKFVFLLLDITTYMFYFFICLEYGLLFVALKIAHYDKPETLAVPAPGGVGGGERDNRDNNTLPLPPDATAADQPPPPGLAGPTARTASVAPTVPVGRIALIIPVGYGVPKNDSNAHMAILNSKLAIVDATLHAASAIFSPCDIFVVHNSSASVAVPNDTFRGFCRDRCVYCPLRMGSKSVSAYYTSVMCSRLGYKYCIVMDDDTLLQPSMGVFLHDPDALNCAAYAFAISSTNPDGVSLLTALQDIEYKLSDLNKIIQSAFMNNSGSVLAPHGAINMWKSNILVKVMLKHNCIFHGEDYVMGSILRDMDIEQGRTEEEATRCKMVSSSIVPTMTPTSFKALYLQRVRSWDLASHQFLFGGCCSSANSGRYIYNCLFMKCTMANSIHRLYVLQDIWCAFQDYIRVPLLLYHIINSILSRKCDYLVLGMYILMIGGQLVSAFCLEYGKFRNRRDLAIPTSGVKLACCFTFPAYRMVLVFARVHAALRYHLRYSSIKRKAKCIEEMKLPVPKEKKTDVSYAFGKGMVGGSGGSDGLGALAAIATPLPTVKQEVPTVDALGNGGQMVKVSFQEPVVVERGMVAADGQRQIVMKKKKKVLIRKVKVADLEKQPGVGDGIGDGEGGVQMGADVEGNVAENDGDNVNIGGKALDHNQQHQKQQLSPNPEFDQPAEGAEGKQDGKRKIVKKVKKVIKVKKGKKADENE